MNIHLVAHCGGEQLLTTHPPSAVTVSNAKCALADKFLLKRKRFNALNMGFKHVHTSLSRTERGRNIFSGVTDLFFRLCNLQRTH